MLKIAAAMILSFALAACAGKPTSAPTTAAPAAPSVLELGDMTVFDGAQAMLKIHADGTTEMAGRSGSMEIKPGQTASSDTLPIVWTAGPTIKTDGTLVANGEPRIQVTADGKVTELKTHTAIPMTVTADNVTVVDSGKTITLGLGADGTFTVAGGDAKPDKLPRVEGATTAGKRRTVLILVALMMTGGEPHAEPATSSTPAVAPAPAPGY